MWTSVLKHRRCFRSRWPHGHLAQVRCAKIQRYGRVCCCCCRLVSRRLRFYKLRFIGRGKKPLAHPSPRPLTATHAATAPRPQTRRRYESRIAACVVESPCCLRGCERERSPSLCIRTVIWGVGGGLTHTLLGLRASGDSGRRGAWEDASLGPLL